MDNYRTNQAKIILKRSSATTMQSMRNLHYTDTCQRSIDKEDGGKRNVTRTFCWSEPLGNYCTHLTYLRALRTIGERQDSKLII